MSSESSSSHCLTYAATPNGEQEAVPLDPAGNAAANFHPTLWEDDFLTLKVEDVDVDAAKVELQHEELKKEVRKMISSGATTATVGDQAQKLRLIDAIQRLGVSYHFESEIEAELLNMMASGGVPDSGVANDLNSAALWFRLLRQQGFRVSSDILENFKDGEGNFKASLVSDVPAMLSLYEASFLAIPGEDILDQAMAFTTQNLGSSSAAAETMCPKLAEEVRFALRRPIRKRLQRLETRHFIDTYQTDESHNGALLRFAQLDFNILQRQYQEELRGIHEWWKSLDVPTNFPHARDRIVEGYFWILGAYFEPKYRLARRLLTEFIGILSLTDDTYDNYATSQQLDVFTQAIDRWDANLISGLPERMKMLYETFVYIFNEFEEAVSGEGRSFGCRYAKTALDRTLKAYLMEAKWRDANYFPKLEEYMEVSLVTTCYPLLMTVSFLAMEAATEEAFDWLARDPKSVMAAATICRLMDDIVSHKLEQERKHVASAVECYVEKHKVTEEVAVEVFNEQVGNAWKDINEVFLRPTAVAAPLLERILNLARVMDVLHKEADGYTNSYHVKDIIASILKEPISIDATV